MLFEFPRYSPLSFLYLFLYLFFIFFHCYTPMTSCTFFIFIISFMVYHSQKKIYKHSFYTVEYNLYIRIFLISVGKWYNTTPIITKTAPEICATVGAITRLNTEIPTPTPQAYLETNKRFNYIYVRYWLIVDTPIPLHQKGLWMVVPNRVGPFSNVLSTQTKL